MRESGLWATRTLCLPLKIYDAGKLRRAVEMARLYPVDWITFDGNLFVILPEIPPPSGAEEEEGGEIWNGRFHHLCSHQHHLVPTALHVTGPVSSRSDQSAFRRLHPAQHRRIRGQNRYIIFCVHYTFSPQKNVMVTNIIYKVCASF